MEQKFSSLVNLLWEACILNLNTILTEEEANKFSNNDYYYLLVIQSLQKPNFSQIAEKLSITKPAVSVIIRKLISMDLVSKSQSIEDKRIYYVELTDKGRRILQGDNAIYKWVVDNIADIAANQEELQVVERIFNELVKRLENKGR
ncbi:MarR family transcriptional regulator [Lachnospiraceae bacterium MD1]|uniref:MarR family transcriptional regulator n=1 Tax=Variimorphobacter saccharofermentans TaxID=2755051 RepID=A0A839K338_9FIRM|nr:MarR family transcriptional regulator [Variimorphobacter saccharofermentans]MBB2183419.1 MarR family transcriptional regulator [Variimorphobacter saccharofermentans]